MRKYFIAAFFLPLMLVAQDGFHYSDYDWGEAVYEKPENKDYSDYREVELKFFQAVQLVVEDETAQDIEIHHRKTYVVSDEGVDANNKIYLPYSGDVYLQKARVIRPDGSVSTVSEEDVLEATDEESGRQYRYFALEGLEKGANVEFLYIKGSEPNLDGVIRNYGFDYPVLNLRTEVLYPDHLEYTIKSYGGLGDFEIDTTQEDIIIHRLTLDEVAPLKSEKYYNEAAVRPRFSYKLTGNKMSGDYNINAFSEVSENLFAAAYDAEMDKKDEKTFERIMKESGANDVDDDKEKIRAIEEYLKKEVKYYEGLPTQTIKYEEIFEGGIANDFMLLRLYAMTYKMAGYLPEIVSTTDRYDSYFDPEAELYSQLADIGLYFPDHDGYVIPSGLFERFPYPNTNWTKNYGMFISGMELGGNLLGVNEVRYIESPAYQVSMDSLAIAVDLNDYFEDALSYKLYRSYTGYDAGNLQPLHDFIKGEDEIEFVESLVKTIEPDAEVSDVSFENGGGEYLYKEPYVVKATFESDLFIEEAGDKLLFKMGELIGPQMELYQEGERTYPIDAGNPHGYKRRIEFTIPDGYVLRNADKLEHVYTGTNDEGEENMAFRTTYTQDGNTVVVENIEYYADTDLPVSDYEMFRDVINAAANFNKIVLVLEPEQ